MLETIFGMMYRQTDGRDGKPMLWNAYLYLGLGYICYTQLGFEWTALAVYAITLVNILRGYHSFTIKWFDDLGGGFHTWHTCYRFLIPSIAICALTSWNFYWLGATVIAGALFPLSLVVLKYISKDKSVFYGEWFAKIREAILGAIVIGGLPWLI
tara:strand:- start:1836 stop:2300 length:465 start_codon:yes stop_codon:yes gene_type:complete